MPKGRKRNSPEATKAEQKQTASSVEAATRSMMNVIDQEIRVKGSLARKQILEHGPQYLDAIERLALGIKMAGTGLTEEGEQIVYTLPPLWSAVKYLADWYRQLLGEGEVKRTQETHDIPEDTKRLLKDWMAQQNMARPALPEAEEGVYRITDE